MTPPDAELAELLEDYADRWLDLDEPARMIALGLALRVVVRLERRSAVTVLEEVDDDGTTIVRARPAQVGLDWRFIVGAIVTLVSTGLVPYLIATGGHP
jgi:hypothetical protein